MGESVEFVGPDRDIKPGLRIRSGDYGRGTVVAIVGSGVQVHWDDALVGTDQHYLVHDELYVRRQRLLTDE
jgi:hypothetical protein